LSQGERPNSTGRKSIAAETKVAQLRWINARRRERSYKGIAIA